MVDISPSNAMPRLSPSLTSPLTSVNSSLPSPKEGEPLIEPNIKFSSVDNRSISRSSSLGEHYFHLCGFTNQSPSSLPPVSPYRPRPTGIPSPAGPKAHTVDPQQNKFRFHPYVAPVKATALELRIAARSLGFSSPSARTLEDTQRAKEFFIRALVDIPRGVLQRVYECKLADRECVAHRVALSAAELRLTERRKHMLISIQEHRRQDLSASEEQLDILRSLLDMTNIMDEDVEGDAALQCSKWEDELKELTVAEQETQHVEEAVKAQDRLSHLRQHFSVAIEVCETSFPCRWQYLRETHHLERLQPTDYPGTSSAPLVDPSLCFTGLVNPIHQTSYLRYYPVGASREPFLGMLSRVVKGNVLVANLTDKVCRVGLPWRFLGRVEGDLDECIRAVSNALKYPHQYQSVADDVREKLLRRLKAEVAAWYRLQHRNICPLYGVIQSVYSIAMVSPWCNNGTFMQYIQREGVRVDQLALADRNGFVKAPIFSTRLRRSLALTNLFHVAQAVPLTSSHPLSYMAGLSYHLFGEAQASVANAKDDLLAACHAAEHAATSAASMPRYLAIATNRQFADAINGTMNGAREALILALTCMEAIINFLIGIYRSTFLCFLELVVVGGLGLLISAVQEITSFLQSTLNNIASGIKSDITSVNSAIQSAVNSINKVNPFGNIQAPQFNLNNSLPTVSSIKNTIQDLVDMPLEAVKADINNTFLGLTFDPVLLPVPAQNAVSFCNSLDTSSIDNLGGDLLQITKIGTVILIVVLLLLLAGHSVFEWYKWRCLMRHLRFTREAWMSDPTIYHATSSKMTTPSVTLTDHNILMLQADGQHPLLTRIAFTLASQLRFTPSQHIHLRWFLHYIFHPPALACFLIGFFGSLSVQIQLIAISPLEAKYSAQAAASVQDLSNTNATQMNNSMYNQSAAYASTISAKVETVQSSINNDLFGWVNGTTTTLNSTLNNFYTDIQNLVSTVFNGTILETPAQDFIKCLIGSKVDAIEEALTFLNQNLNVDLPQVNKTILVLSSADIDEIAQPVATAAIGGTSSNSQGLVGRLVAMYVDSLKKERLMFHGLVGGGSIDGPRHRVLALICRELGGCLQEAEMAKRTVRRPRWTRSAVKGGAPLPHVGDTEKPSSILEPPLCSFTPLPEARSPFSINLFRRPNQASLPSHPLKSLEPTFEKSWDSFFHEGTNNSQSAASGPRRVVGRPMKLMNFGKTKGDEVLEATKGDRSEDKPKSVWFKSVTGFFSRQDSVQPVSGFVVNRPVSGACSPRPQLSISVEQALGAIPRDLPKIDTTPSPAREEPSSVRPVSPVPPTLPLAKNNPPRKAIPLTIPPPPPGRARNANVPTDVGSTPPDNGPLAMPLHNAFEEHSASQKPVHLTLYPTFFASYSEETSSRERHKRSSTISQHESTRSTSRLLTNIHAQSSSDTVDLFATPFDDDVLVSPAKTKRATNAFSGFAL
ncbi:hypothetical protein JVT61DRAFT_10597 [Boletus reticuloceps]|uniref:Plasma membrane fusion protein PRM1 n=1 Tax=Boletus reticuloceps TaxID=495285 RepID=A0A8I3A614_9AGAM|nr:hypothetical protein JVT61DRAFT_10597 [Boletus reticuloceps]